MSFDMMINAESLIALVKSRPVLWDKSLDSRPSQRTAAWKDICRVLIPDFNTITKTQQHSHVRYIRKRWVNIRDAWKKSVTVVKRKAYKHSARLKFLEKNLENKKNISSSIAISDNDSDTDSYSSKSSDIKKEKIKEEKEDDIKEVEEEDMKEEEEKIGNEESIQGENEVNPIQFMDIKPIDENCPHISFIKGLLPILSKLGEDEVLEFQMGVIQLLQGIRRRGVTVNQISGQRYDMPSSASIYHI